MEIVNLFFNLSGQHKQVRGFMYGRAYDKGIGSEAHPLVWLDDPISGGSINVNAVRYSVNIDILGLPVDDRAAATVQTAMFSIGADMIEQLRKTQRVTGFGVESYSFLSLRQYYDNDAAGYRFTIQLTGANPANRCADNFDPDKTIATPSPLPVFDTEYPDGCAIFNDKSGLPIIKTS